MSLDAATAQKRAHSQAIASAEGTAASLGAADRHVAFVSGGALTQSAPSAAAFHAPAAAAATAQATLPVEMLDDCSTPRERPPRRSILNSLSPGDGWAHLGRAVEGLSALRLRLSQDHPRRRSQKARVVNSRATMLACTQNTYNYAQRKSMQYAARNLQRQIAMRRQWRNVNESLAHAAQHDSYKFDGEESKVHFDRRFSLPIQHKNHVSLLSGAVVSVMGAGLGFLAAGMNLAVYSIHTYAMKLVQYATWKGVSDGHPRVGVGLSVYLASHGLIVLVAALLTHWAPLAANSGLPKIKSFLNGTYIRGGMLGARTLVAKVLGITLCASLLPRFSLSPLSPLSPLSSLSPTLSLNAPRAEHQTAIRFLHLLHTHMLDAPHKYSFHPTNLPAHALCPRVYAPLFAREQCRVVASGLPLGKEGPMVHIGAMFAAILTKASVAGKQTPLELRLPQPQREWIGMGAAAGVAAAFNAPFGGILYSFEEVCSQWSRTLTWRSFLGCMLVAITYRGLVELSGGELGSGFATGLKLDDTNDLFATGAVVWIILLGAAGGLLGATCTRSTPVEPAALALVYTTCDRTLGHRPKSPSENHSSIACSCSSTLIVCTI